MLVGNANRVVEGNNPAGNPGEVGCGQNEETGKRRHNSTRQLRGPHTASATSLLPRQPARNGGHCGDILLRAVLLCPGRKGPVIPLLRSFLWAVAITLRTLRWDDAIRIFSLIGDFGSKKASAHQCFAPWHEEEDHGVIDTNT